MLERQKDETPAATGVSLKQLAHAGSTRRRQYIAGRTKAQYQDQQTVDAFLKAMVDAGINPVFTRGGIEPDGRLVRFHVQGDRKGSRNGWAILFGDGIPAGAFGTWKDGAGHNWCAKSQSELTDDERQQIATRMAEAKAARENEERERQGQAAALANLLWKEAVPADDSHPYLVRKAVRAYGIRTATWVKCNDDGEEWLRVPNALLVPLMLTNGRIVSLQSIFPDKNNPMGRDKDFMPGGRKRGAFHLIGTPPTEGETIVVAEGYATAASIHDATHWCVAVAFDAGNMVSVAEELRAMMPTANFVIAADNDRWSSMGDIDNPGVHFAERAAYAVRGRLVVPQFEDLDGRPTDFNDLHVREGIDVVQRQMMPPTKQLAPINEDGDEPPVEFDPRAVDSATPFGEIDGKGRPLATIGNLSELLRRAAITVRYNVVSKDIEIAIPGASTSDDNARNVRMNEIVSLCASVNFPQSNVERFVVSVADRQQYNPVATWIRAKPWDGATRFEALVDTIETRDGFDRDWLRVLLRKWLISAVAAVFIPRGFSSKGVLTLQGVQSAGKTTWLKRLVPFELQHFVKTDLILNPRDKDDIIRATTCWLAELGELDATFRKADIAALKGFISRSEDDYRRPYAVHAEQIQRRTVFFASVNDEQFLHDPTGNARWWVVPVQRLNLDHGIDTQQLWAEALTWFQAEYHEGPGLRPWDLTAAELDRLNRSNRDFESQDALRDLIFSDYSKSVSPIVRRMTAADVLREMYPGKIPSNADCRSAGKALRELFGEPRKSNGSLHWDVPPKRGGSTEPF